MPVTMPVVLTVALVLSLLLQEPPEVASVKLLVDAMHTLDEPIIAGGNGFIVTTALPSAPQQPDDDRALK